MTQISTGGYVRHRDRMVQESVFEDLQNTLIACRWMAGTTTRPVVDPANPQNGWDIVTTAAPMNLVGKREDGTTPAEVVLIDYFPEASGTDDDTGKSRKTEWNTLAIDAGVPQNPQTVELGSNMVEQDYLFTFAFYASSDAVAIALGNDLRDRYMGRIVGDDHINLYDYNDPTFSPSTPPITRMECNYFRWAQNLEQVSPWEVHLYFGELSLTDFVDDWTPTQM